MTLEEIAKTYGMHDYYDPLTGNIYQLSEAFDDGYDILIVPVINQYGNKNHLVGYAKIPNNEIVL